jgi:hypothetical protein
MTLKEFLEYETPHCGGCMVCEVIKDDGKNEFLLIERRRIANGDMFLINGKFFYGYESIWEENSKWKIIFKKIA